MEHAHQNVGSTGRIGQRPEDVKNGAHTQLFAHRSHVFHGRMVVRRKHKANADLFDGACDLLRRQIDVATQGLNHIGAARFAADAAPTMFGGFSPSSSGHKHGAGRDVESVSAVTSRSNDVDQVRGIGHMHFGRELTHDLGCCSDLADGFLLHTQTGDQRSRHHR